jgi:hypothetical protein
VLIGIVDASFATSKVVEIALYSRTIKAVLTSPSGGSFDSLVVRSGVVYLARTRQISLSPTASKDVYDAVALSSTYSVQPLVNTSSRIGLLEVYIDKGTVTTFVYLPSTAAIQACYPDSTCSTLATLNNANGLACGADCPAAVYVSAGTKIFKVNSNDGAVMLKNTGSAIYCLTGISALNTLLYKSTTTIIQHSLSTQTSTGIPLGLADTGLKRACSLDVSELYNQILIVQDGVVRTLESVQLICGYGLTSQRCWPMPQPLACHALRRQTMPSGLRVVPSVSGHARPEYTRIGSKCAEAVVAPCPAFYVPDTGNAGLCVPSRHAMGRAGKVCAVRCSSPASDSARTGPPLPHNSCISASVLIEVSVGNFYVSRDNGQTWDGD